MFGFTLTPQLTPPLLLQATEMLLFNRKLTAAEACHQGLVSEVFPDSSFQSEVWTRLKSYAKLPAKVSQHTLPPADGARLKV